MSVHTHLSGRATTALLPQLAAARSPRYAWLADALAGLLLDGRVAPGTRLPSERELSTSLGVSRATVTAAYDVLRSRGYLSSRSGSGSVAQLPAGANRPVGSARWVTESTTGDVIDLTCATLPAPAELLMNAVSAATEQLPAYAVAEGYEPAGVPVLRNAVAERFTARGLPTRPDQVLITNGALHGVDLLLRLLINPGDRILTELPTYSGLLDAMRGSGATLVPVPIGPHGGWSTSVLSAALRQGRPHVALVMPDFHNPTGALVPDDHRTQVLRVARQTGTTVVVDESYVDLALSRHAVAHPATPMAALDRSVVTVGALSKPFWGGLRIGWVRGSTEMITRLTALRARTDMGGPIFEQLVAAEVMPHLDESIQRRRQELRPRLTALLTELKAQLPAWRARRPDGGLSLWIELDDAISTPLAMTASNYGVRIVPGARFGLDGTLERFLRIPFTAPEATLRRAVRRLAEARDNIGPAAVSYPPLIVA